MASEDHPDQAVEPTPTIEGKLYSVPRRFDLVTLFVVMAAYALLFGGMRLCGAKSITVLKVSVLITLVGLGQASLYKGKKPRTASIIVSVVLWPMALFVIDLDVFSIRASIPFQLAAICLVFYIALVGYLAGTLVAGVFLVADVVRRRIGR